MQVFEQYTSRRMLVSEWVDGVKLANCTPTDIQQLTEVGAEVFLFQLLHMGSFHGDPHPGASIPHQTPQLLHDTLVLEDPCPVICTCMSVQISVCMSTLSHLTRLNQLCSTCWSISGEPTLCSLSLSLAPQSPSVCLTR